MNLPPTWATALARIQMVTPDAVIAGGALRDTLLGRPVKDIDVFASSEFVASRAVALELHRLFDCPAKIVISEAWAEYNAMLDGVACAVEVSPDNITGLPLQVILMDHPVTMQSAVERIDFGLCRVAHNGKELFLHPDFVHDQLHECFTIRRCRNAAQLWRSRGRHVRLQAKYQGWPLVLTAAALAHDQRPVHPVPGPHFHAITLHT